MVYSSVIFAFIFVFLVSAIGTSLMDVIFRFFGRRGYLGNLYPNVRGGIPRGVGIIPAVILSFYMLPGFNTLVLVIAIFAFIDDIIGRRRISLIGIEWGQLSRGIGILSVMIIGFVEGFGVSSIFIAMMVQPLNIADMQPGSACVITMIMSILTTVLMLIVNVAPVGELPAVYTPLLIFIVCLAYCPLDFSGKIMLGEVGNHSFGVSLGCAFYLLGGLPVVLIMFIVTTIFTAFVRRSTLKVFFRQQLGLFDPTFGDFFMDVLTGGGLGDLIRRLVFKNNQPVVNNPLLISLGFRRLLYNPDAYHPRHHVSGRGSLSE